MARKQQLDSSSQGRPDLAANIAVLSRKRQERFRQLFENPRAFVLLNVRELAERLKVDPATVIRSIMKMGFRSYREFQHYIHQLSVSQATSLDSMQSSKTKGSSPSAHVKEAVEHDVRNLQRFRNALDTDRIADVAKRVHAAKRILILGGDLAAYLAGFLHYHMMLLGLPAITAISSGEAAHLSRSTGKDDLIIAISFRRGLRQTVEGLKQARANGAYCVGITDTLISPIARFSHESFIASVDTPSFGASYAAPMCLVNGILTACAYFEGQRTISLVKKAAEEQRHGFRWYQD